MNEINFFCSACGNGILLDGPPFPEISRCSACRAEYPLKAALVQDAARSVETCPRCESRVFYVQKDFNRNLGLIVTILSALAVYVIFGLTWKSLAGLLVIAALDALLYRALPLITICYQCKAIFRGFPIHPAHLAFDLHIGEQYRKN